MGGGRLKRFKAALQRLDELRRSCLQGETLRSIFEFVGAGEFLFMAGVSKGWRQIYELADGYTTTDLRCNWRSSSLSLIGTTLMSAVFESPARVLLAATGEHALCLTKGAVRFLAGLHGELAALEAASKLEMPFDDPLLRGVARAGHLTELVWAYNVMKVQMPEEITEHAAVSGNVKMLEWLRACGCALTQKTSLNAAAAGHLSAVRYLNRIDICDRQACTAAAENGHFPLVQWMIANACVWESRVVARAAAAYNDMPMLLWLHEEYEVEFDAATMAAAAAGGHLSVCQYLHAEQCEGDAAACSAAASHQHVDTLRRLREHGCPWNVDDICWHARWKQHWSVLRYVFERRGRAEMTAADLLKLAEVKPVRWE
jgi:hypothetical protein